MAWYGTGTISLTAGSSAVTGSGTNFVANAAVGEGLITADGRIYEITAISSATALTISPVYAGSTASGQAFQIVPTQSYIRDLAAQAAELLNDFGDVRDGVGAGLFPDGTLAEPGFRFAADQDTGARRTGANAAALVAGGADVVGWSASGLTAPIGALLCATSGTLRVGVGASSYSRHALVYGGSAQTVAYIMGADSGWQEGTTFNSADSGGYSTANAPQWIGKNVTTGRSANHAGTSNVSGADPAEYHYKAAGCGAIAKGQVVGLDAADRITDQWADAIDFAIKSSDPSTVGGDRWGSPANILAVHGVAHPGRAPGLPDEATPEQILAHAAAMATWTAAKAAFDAAHELERAKVDRLSHGGGRLPCIVSGTVTAGDYVLAQDDGDGGIEAVCASTVADGDRWRIVGRVRIAEPSEAQLRMLINDEVAIDPAWNAIVVQMKG